MFGEKNIHKEDKRGDEFLFLLLNQVKADSEQSIKYINEENKDIQEPTSGSIQNLSFASMGISLFLEDAKNYRCSRNRG